MAGRTCDLPQHHHGLLRFSKRGRDGPADSKDNPDADKGTLEVTRSAHWNVSFSAFVGRRWRIQMLIKRTGIGAWGRSENSARILFVGFRVVNLESRTLCLPFMPPAASSAHDQAHHLRQNRLPMV